MPACLFSVEGVLGLDSSQRGFHPSPSGLQLLGALCSGYKIFLSSTQQRKEAIDHWLTINGIGIGSHYEQLVYREAIYADLSDVDFRIAQLTALRGMGQGISLVVDADARVIAKAVHLGFDAIHWVTPIYYRPEWIPGNATVPQPWAVISEEVDRQLELKRTDARLKEDN